jgi:hypothetical protein
MASTSGKNAHDDGYTALTASNTSKPMITSPNAPGRAIKTAFLAEATLNLFGGLGMVLKPQWYFPFPSAPKLQATSHIGMEIDENHRFLTKMRSDGSLAPPPGPALFQWLGGMTIALSLPLFLGSRDTKDAVYSRRLLYYLLGAGEMVPILVMMWQLTLPETERGLSVRGVLASVACLAPSLVWRGYCLFWREDMFGRYREVDDGELKRE